MMDADHFAIVFMIIGALSIHAGWTHEDRRSGDAKYPMWIGTALIMVGIVLGLIA